MNYKKNYKYGGLYSMLAQGGKPDYLDLDKDGNEEELMREAAKQMSRGGRVYRFGGVNKYQQGGVHNNASSPDIQIMAKDSYMTAGDPQPGRDFIYLVDGQPTNYSHADVANLLKAEGVTGKNLNMRMNELFSTLPQTREGDEKERSFRQAQFNKVLADVGAIARGDADEVKTVTPGAFSKDELGNMLRSVTRGGEATRRRDFEGRYSPTGQQGTPKNVNADEFLRALAENYRN
jgi:hypothetical protein